MIHRGTARRIPATAGSRTAAVRVLSCTLSAIALAALAACAGRPPPGAAPAGPRELPPGFGPGWAEEGVASWYGPGFHGRLTASGERYDMDDLTAAHPWFPFGTIVRVRREDDGRAVRVRVNDRGPFAKGRIIDLSRAAARALGLLGPGTGRVRVEVREVPDRPFCAELQVGAYAEPRNAAAARARIRDAGLAPRSEATPGGLRRILAGPFDDPDEALQAKRRLGGLLRACRAVR